MKNPPLRTDFSFFEPYIYKPNSVLGAHFRTAAAIYRSRPLLCGSSAPPQSGPPQVVARLSARLYFMKYGGPARQLFVSQKLRRTLNSATACGRHNWRTALHGGKDLAVSPTPVARRARLQSLSASETLLFFREKRLCSHLLDCSRRGLPATLLPSPL